MMRARSFTRPAKSVGKPRKQARRRGGLLVLLGLTFALSGVLRLGALDEAWAVEPTAPAPLQDALGPDAPLRAALDEAASLRDRLHEREAELDARERALAAAQVLIEDRLAALELAEARLERLISVSDEAAENDLDQLTRVYETMDPAQAARLFEQMEPSFAAGFLARMPAETSAALMAELQPQTAYAISVVLATRNAGAPRLTPEEIPATDTEN